MPKFTPKYTTFNKSVAGNSYTPRPGQSKAKQHLISIKRTLKQAPKYKY